MQAQFEQDFEPAQFAIQQGRVGPRFVHAHNGPPAPIMARERGPQLRNYRPSEKNEKLVFTKPVIPNEAIVAFLNARNLIYFQIEIYSLEQMPTQEFRIFSSKASDYEILSSIADITPAIMLLDNSPAKKTITEIHVNPVYQTIEGFPKIFTDEDQSISIMSILRNQSHASELHANLHI